MSTEFNQVKRKILILAANPIEMNRLRLDKEIREIEIILRQAKYRDQFELIPRWAVRAQDLRQALIEYQPEIVHFSGHGSNQQIFLENYYGRHKAVSHLALEQLFKPFKNNVQCVVLNACNSENQANAINQQINYVIGMNEPIGDRAAVEFSIGFYEALGAGHSYEKAFEIGCASIALEDLDEFEKPVLRVAKSVIQKDLEPVQVLDRADIKSHSVKQFLISGWITIGISVLVTGVTLMIRSLGLLQGLELQAFDHLMRSRPLEPIDPRLLIVAITPSDLKTYRYPLPDITLAEVIDRLQEYQPGIIGLTLFRELPIEPGYEQLAEHFETTRNLIGICSISEGTNLDNKPGIAPPQNLAITQVGFSDMVLDSDGVVRRHLLGMQPELNSPCQVDNAFSTRIAFQYLATVGKTPELLSSDQISLGSNVFERLLRTKSGEYHQLDDAGFQILLNYRAGQEIAQQVSISEVLAGEIEPEWVENKIVLIGNTAATTGPGFITPLHQQSPLSAVMLQAQMISQLLSHALDGRPLLRVWHPWTEALWIFGWSMIGSLLGWRLFQRSPWYWLLPLFAVAILTLGCWRLLIVGFWVPWASSVLTTVVTTNLSGYISDRYHGKR